MATPNRIPISPIASEVSHYVFFFCPETWINVSLFHTSLIMMNDSKQSSSSSSLSASNYLLDGFNMLCAKLMEEYCCLFNPNRLTTNPSSSSSSSLSLVSSPPRLPYNVYNLSIQRQQSRRTTTTTTILLQQQYQEEREQALRDYKVTIEYKHLKSHAPGGVYLIPAIDNLRHFYGIIFIRRGPYTNGIFKFQLKLPTRYNDVNMWPQITFSSYVYSPYIFEESGELDIQSAYPSWDPSRHYLVTVLTYLKKIFYSKNFADAKANIAAKELAEKNPDAFRKKLDACVRESQKNMYGNEEGSTAKFTEEQVSHRVLRDLLKHHIRNESQVTKQAVLAQIDKARKV